MLLEASTGQKDPFLESQELKPSPSMGKVGRSESVNWMTEYSSSQDESDLAIVFQGKVPNESGCCFNKISFGWAYPALKQAHKNLLNIE
jgi:hypothetical protein